MRSRISRQVSETVRESSAPCRIHRLVVGEGMSGVSYDEALFTDEEKDVIDGFFTSFGKMEKVDEKLMDVVGSASGCSPAYVYMFIERWLDAA